MNAGFPAFPLILKGTCLQNKTVTRSYRTEKLDARTLAILSVSKTKAGTIRSICEYVDLATGEIIPADELDVRTLNLSTILPARAKALNSLRPEVRRFAAFVLKFANRRRDITPGIDTLCRWYADLNNKRSSDVRRYIPALKQAGILAGDTLLGRPFQRTATTSTEVMGEEVDASTKYLLMRRHAQDKSISSRQGRAAPSWLVDETVAALEAELQAEEAAYAAIQKAATTLMPELSLETA
ncbi:hypothetical protein M2165_002506 [Variovorax sp. TBS-050B]|uniref:hypothetical protein n=1 Tax=Variovorax sp. TBS-050B TaxID=2940551 RepID=UPI002474B5BB|nr:hypothetical protein [Variovorax sp. TBS-050B]MDH6592617.1 hypothetical protein [Variovorax sp. TBS-050B]